MKTTFVFLWFGVGGIALLLASLAVMKDFLYPRAVPFPSDAIGGFQKHLDIQDRFRMKLRYGMFHWLKRIILLLMAVAIGIPVVVREKSYPIQENCDYYGIIDTSGSMLRVVEPAARWLRTFYEARNTKKRVCERSGLGIFSNEVPVNQFPTIHFPRIVEQLRFLTEKPLRLSGGTEPADALLRGFFVLYGDEEGFPVESVRENMVPMEDGSCSVFQGMSGKDIDRLKRLSRGEFLYFVTDSNFDPVGRQAGGQKTIATKCVFELLRLVRTPVVLVSTVDPAEWLRRAGEATGGRTVRIYDSNAWHTVDPVLVAYIDRISVKEITGIERNVDFTPTFVLIFIVFIGSCVLCYFWIRWKII